MKASTLEVAMIVTASMCIVFSIIDREFSGVSGWFSCLIWVLIAIKRKND